MIKVPSYLDFITKLVNYLGIDFNEDENKTNKCRLKEQRTFHEQVNKYKDYYLKEICTVLAGSDEEKIKFIHNLLAIIEKSMRYLSNKNYYTIASGKRGVWALWVFYYIPQLACMLSLYKKEYDIPSVLINNDFMLPQVQDNNVILPTSFLKKYLKRKVKNNKFLANYLHELRKDITPRHQTKFRILEKISASEDENDLQEIESVINCAIFASNLYQELYGIFKDENYVLMLIDYFRKCSKVSDELCRLEIDMGFLEKFGIYVHYIHFHLDYLHNEMLCTAVELENPLRKDLFDCFNSYLYETRKSEVDILEEIDTPDLSKSILRYYVYDINQSIDREHDEILFLLKELKSIFEDTEKKLNPAAIDTIFAKVESNSFFKNYEHEYLYYAALNHLAKNELSDAINTLKKVLLLCTKITAGETRLRTAELLVVLRLLSERTTNYFHLNPEIKEIIDSQAEELILQFSPSPQATIEIDKKKNLDGIYLDKTLKIIVSFNANRYCRYDGFPCLKYNPFQKMESFVTDFFQLYDDEKYASEAEESKIEKIVKALMTGRSAKYPLKRPLVTLLPFTPLQAFQEHNPARIFLFYKDSKMESHSLERLLCSETLLDLLNKTLKNLTAIPSNKD